MDALGRLDSLELKVTEDYLVHLDFLVDLLHLIL